MRAPSKLALTPSPPSLGEVLDFMRLVWALHHGLQRTSKRMKVAIGVTGPQRLVIRIVTRFPGIPAGQIAELLHVHPSTLTGILRRLESQGLINRRPDPKDGRRAFLGITEKGKRIDAAGAGTVEAVVKSLLERTSRSKLDGARAVLADLASDLAKGV